MSRDLLNCIHLCYLHGLGTQLFTRVHHPAGTRALHSAAPGVRVTRPKSVRLIHYFHYSYIFILVRLVEDYAQRLRVK